MWVSAESTIKILHRDSKIERESKGCRNTCTHANVHIHTE
jgi:hypothetical protein